MHTILGNGKCSGDGIYHAFAPRFAARYLAEVQYRVNRRYELEVLPQRLLRRRCCHCRVRSSSPLPTCTRSR